MILSYGVGPLVYYILIEETLLGAGKGYMIGSVVSVILWLVLVYGSKFHLIILM
jgi:hypothetical protein